MNDLELADLIERKGVLNAVQSIAGTERKSIAALRRVPEPIDTRMADLLVDTTWRKAVGQCVADVCGLDGKPLGKRCDRLFISRERFDEHIAPLIRQCERPPSGEMGYEEYHDGIIGVFKMNADGSRNLKVLTPQASEQFRAMLSAVEAEGRKS